jgi:hypothetical protein
MMLKNNIQIILFAFLIIMAIQCCWSKSFVLADVKNNAVTITTKKNEISVFIFAQNPCCHLCFMKLNDRLAEIRENYSKIKVYIVIEYQDDIVNRKLDINYFKELVDADSVYFDYNNKTITKDSTKFQSWFKYYKITSTPSVLLVLNNQEKYISFKNLKNSNYTILEDKIKELVDTK